MKERFSKEYLQWLRLILRLKLNEKIKIAAVNTWAVSVMRFGVEILKWNMNELKSLGRRTRKFMAVYGALHPKSDVDRVYLSREITGRESISYERCIRMEENNLACRV